VIFGVGEPPRPPVAPALAALVNLPYCRANLRPTLSQAVGDFGA
jgi:hypothetical protein